MAGDPLTAAVLVGGQSRRMGTAKALLRLEPGGPTLVETVVARVQAVVPDVILIGNEPAPYAFLGLPIHPDAAPGAGPLAGIAAALAAARHDRVLVLACDLPDLAVPLLQRLAADKRAFDVLVPEIGQLQPLLAMYQRRCLPLIERQLAHGSLRLSDLLDEAKTLVIPEAEVRRYDPDLRSATNLNTPDDVNRWTC